MRVVKKAAVGAAFLFALGILIWQGMRVTGSADPLRARPGYSAAIMDIGVLVFREGLECILVLAAITAGMNRSKTGYGSAIAIGAGVGFGATLLTWFVVVGVMDDLSKHVSALQLLAATGLLAIVVLLVVMNWFFHWLYWTGWISLHNKKKHSLLQEEHRGGVAMSNVFFGLALLGFTSFYREGVEVVLFLQGYRLRMGGQEVLRGVCVGLILTAAVGVLTFVAHRKLPYKRMLVVTGVLLGAVLLIMVGEQVQEMQLAHWLPTTELPVLAHLFPAWAGQWLSLFPNVEGLVARCMAAILVIGSYFVARKPRAAERYPATKPQRFAVQR